ncbi:uncharacterized protein LOC129969125 isoform X2 [Argiope bruennichi]|uniref:uncharacterized protein LOC129969125 isoform X2 n=1 Tax=Argiope bruennichi TaxID=94029 RepID=UPI002493EA95|nr:uncharacterized protein LOC129969125 isoform X2 [Argiope bruennichi]
MSVDRGFTWMDDETLALIEIFSKEDIQYELNCLKRNIGVYGRIASELAEVGYRRTAYQCREKIKRLRKEYHSSKHCIENNITPKKPMKYFDLVDKIFDRDSSSQINNVDLNPLSSDHEEELHLTFNHEQESDASNSCATIEFAASQLPGTSRSTKATGDTDSAILCKNKQKDASTENRNDCENVSVLNSAHLYDLSDKEDTGNPWTPDVVLVEQDAPTALFENQSSASTSSMNENLTGRKKRKLSSQMTVFKYMMDSMTLKFMKYQTDFDKKILNKIEELENERSAMDERIQKMWMDFEEKRRVDEKEHELKIMTTFQDIINGMKVNEE